MDFNNAPEQKEGGLIPSGTIAVVHMTIRPGNTGEGGWEKRSNAGDSQALDCEFTVVDGPYAKRKFWSLFTVSGQTEGQQKAAQISGSRIRGILESARGIRPDDESDNAKNGRRISSYGELDGLRFIAKIGVEVGKKKNPTDPSPTAEKYNDKNSLNIAITPDRKEWVKVEQVKSAGYQSQATAGVIAAAATSAAPSGKPSWA